MLNKIKELANNIKELNKSQKISMFICLSLFFRTLNITINETLALSYYLSISLKIILICIYAFLALYLFLNLSFKGKKILIFSEVIIFALMTISTLTYFPSLKFSIYMTYGWILISFIPIVVSLYYLDDLHILYKYLYKSSFIMALLCTLIYYFHIRTISTNLVFSYTLLLPLLIQVIELLSKKKYFLTFLVFFEGYMLLTYGSRGTLICVITFFFLICLKKGGLKYFKYLLFLLILLFVSYQILYHSGIFTKIYNYFMTQGKYSRILDLISTGEFFNNNGRFAIYSNYLHYIAEKPIFGWGIGADLYVGIFPHNVLIEIIFNFGIFSILIFYVFFILIKNYLLFFAKKDTYNLFLVFLCSGVFPLFFSSTYLEWMNFWIFFGFLLSVYRKTNL